MASRCLVVRRAAAGDAALLEAVSATASAVRGGVPAQRTQREASELRDRVRALLAHPDVEVHLALSPTADDVEVAVGVAVLRRGEVVLPAPAPLLHVEQLWVDPAWRRRGVGHQLLAAVLAAAEAAGVEEVTAAVAPGERDAQRFLARLGFARPVVVRAAPLPVLRSRLAAALVGDRGGAVGRRRAALDQLVARRRRQLDRPPDPGAGPAAGPGAGSAGSAGSAGRGSGRGVRSGGGPVLRPGERPAAGT